MANRLENETSPYLRQHQDNPVDWYPWGEEALEKARREDLPILLSVGYAACHWCHVMAHESFEDEATARLMNENFVNVKVDREERPDIDSIYMSAVQAMTGSGGWPMTVVMTPEGEPFFGGTYFPPEDRYGQPAFRRVLSGLASAWQDRRDEVLKSAGELRNYLEAVSSAGRHSGEARLDAGVTTEALQELQRQFDTRNGGFGGAPKFPPHTALRFLLARRSEEAHALAHTTLRKMACGGIFDQLGGGFARYSVDAGWLVPHFEKMLYDNAQLLSRYAEAYSYDANPLYAHVMETTIEWLERELRDDGGAFYSSLDADSEGEEGRFYVWTAGEFAEVLGDEAALAGEWFGVTAAGNFEGRNVLSAPEDPEAFAARHGLSEGELSVRVREWREKLFAARSPRERPALDDKILTSWNGLAIGGLADAGRALHRQQYVDLARDCARFLRDNAWAHAHLQHVVPARGLPAHSDGLLEDYALLGLGLLSLYRATFEAEWLLWALELADRCVELFADPEGGFYSTPSDGEELIVRPRSLSDSALPSDSAAAAELLVNAARLTGEYGLEEQARRAVTGVVDAAGRHPTAFGSALFVIDYLLHPPREVAVVGDEKRADTRTLLRLVQQQPLPFTVVALSDGPDDELAGRLPFLRERGMVDGKAAAYVCEAGACRLPVTSPDDLARELVEQAR